jgi:DNA-damage-inducible protein J
MPITSINILTDSEIKAKAQEVFAALGLDMTTAVNLFLRQTVRMNDFPFVMITGETRLEKHFKPPHSRGCMKGKMWVADDFDAPLEDFREYME